MGNIAFNREYWLDQLKKEVGLENVAYEDLAKHQVNFGSVFSLDETEVRNAKQYVDDQLMLIEAQYQELDIVPSADMLQVSEFDAGGVLSRLTEVSDALPDVIPELPSFSPSNDSIKQLPEIKQEIKSDQLKYFDVLIGGNPFTVVINDHGDFRIQDQINHLVNTSFFVEARKPHTLTGYEVIISYYQFVNAIQPFLKQNTDLSAFERITKGIHTQFDGFKLEGF